MEVKMNKVFFVSSFSCTAPATFGIKQEVE